jgi:hypothetical protein
MLQQHYDWSRNGLNYFREVQNLLLIPGIETQLIHPNV